MTTTITCTYTVPLMGSQSSASLLARMKAIPCDLTLPHLLGLRYASDSSAISGSNVIRTMTFKMTPISGASASTGLQAGNRGSSLLPPTVQSAGSGYAAPPVVAFSGGDAPDGTPPYDPASINCTMKLTDFIIINGGSGYGDGDLLTFSGGGVGSSIVQPTAEVASIGPGGTITTLQILSAGSGLTQPPDAVVVSSGGTGAVLSAGLGVAAVNLIRNGQGYGSVPSIGFTPSFVAAFTTSAAQAKALANFMTGIFTAALNSDVLAATPVVS